MSLYPIKMTPAYRYGSMTPWGGNGLRAYGKHIPDERTGESLEVSVLAGLESRDEAGRTLPELLAEHGEAMRGTQVGEVFPLLLKLINAEDWLSVQVHPDDAYAGKNEGGKLGKTEAWVILSAKEDAQLIYGIREGVTHEQLSAACACGGDAVRACLNFVPAKAGDVFFIPAGMVHALGSGITLMEIQQSSDVTYRFYDWDRVDAQGKGRELHIQKGLDVVDLNAELKPTVGKVDRCAGGEIITYIEEDAFTLARLHVTGDMPLEATAEHFRLLCALGDCRLQWKDGSMALHAGDCVFLPAQLVSCVLTGEADALICWPGKA